MADELAERVARLEEENVALRERAFAVEGFIQSLAWALSGVMSGADQDADPKDAVARMSDRLAWAGAGFRGYRSGACPQPTEQTVRYARAIGAPI